MATHSSILAWKIPWTEEPGELQSMGLQRVGHDSTTDNFHLILMPIRHFINNRQYRQMHLEQLLRLQVNLKIYISIFLSSYQE